MTFLKTLLLTTAAAMAFATTTQAASVTWNFTGNWLNTDYGPHGTGLAGSVTFDTVAGTATAFSFTVTGYPGDVAYSMVGTGYVGVYDNQGYDLLTFRVPVSMSGPGSLVGSLPWQTASLTLYDPSQTMLSSPAIPTTVPALSGILAKNITLIYGQATFSDTYQLTSLTDAVGTPEPTSVSLVALGLGGAAFLCRRR